MSIAIKVFLLVAVFCGVVEMCAPIVQNSPGSSNTPAPVAKITTKKDETADPNYKCSELTDGITKNVGLVSKLKCDSAPDSNKKWVSTMTFHAGVSCMDAIKLTSEIKTVHGTDYFNPDAALSTVTCDGQSMEIK